jgi:hypothetical protein
MGHLTTFEVLLAIASGICLVYGIYQYFKLIMR